MRRDTFSLALLACLLTPVAHASSFLASTDTLGASLANSVEATSDASSSAFDDKRIVEARDEAASFVASHGQLRSAQLDQALTWLRAKGLNGSDQHLAEAILAH